MNNQALINTIWPNKRSLASKIIRNLILVFLGSIILIISSKIKVGWPIPMTMQTFVVFIMSLTYGWKLASSTFFLYLLQGLKWEVFAWGGGINYYITSPTVGFLFGMFMATFVIGYLAEKNFNIIENKALPIINIIRNIIIIFLGTCVIFLFGLTYMSFFMGWEKAILYGLKPFILSESIKILLASVLMPYVWKIVKIIKNK